MKFMQLIKKIIFLYERPYLYIKMSQEISELCDEYIGFFLKNIDKSNLAFPILNNTYSLWRKFAIKKLKDTLMYGSDQDQAIHQFFMYSECHLLRGFVQSLKEQSNKSSIALKTILAQESIRSEEIRKLNKDSHQQTLIYYGECLWKQQLYAQLFLDLTTVEYLKYVFPPQKVYKIKEEYEMDYLNQEVSTNPLINKVQKSIVNKGLGKLTERLFSKTFLLQINTMAGTFNPLVIAASFGISKSLQIYDKSQKEKQTLDHLKEAIAVAEYRTQNMETLYEQTLILIGKMLLEHSSLQITQIKKQIQKNVFKVIEKDWLKVSVRKEGEWEVVDFIQNDDFENLTASVYVPHEENK